MTMWIIILWSVLAYWAASMLYLGFRLPHLFDFAAITDLSRAQRTLIGLFIAFGFVGIMTLCIDFINAIVCVMYLAMIWVVSDFAFLMLEKIAHLTFAHYYAGWMALAVTVVTLIFGWYSDHHVWQTNYELTTHKDLSELKIAMFADSHIGTTFDDKEFAKHMQAIEAQNPDILVIVGDYVDDGTSREQMIQSTRALGKMKTKYGIYFVSGNHDKGYYGAEHRGFSEHDLFAELKDNGITILQDEAVLINDAFYVVGRRDFSEVKEQGKARRTINELIENLDKDKYMVVLDHQPVEYDKDADAKVDLVLSGHTHGGQLFPFNQVGKWVKVNDLIYGYEKRKDTDFIVTSGISDWAIKFKTGTKSEYVIIDIKKK